MPAKYWRKLYSSLAVHVPLRYLKPFRTSWNSIESANRLLTIMAMTFHITSTIPMLWYLTPPLGIRMTLDPMHSVAHSPVSNASYIIYTTILQMEESGISYSCAAARHIFKCSTCIPNPHPPPDLDERASHPILFLWYWLIMYHKNDCYNTHIVILQKHLEKYNHLQPPDVTAFSHSGRNFYSSHISQYQKYIHFFRGLTLIHTYITTKSVPKIIPHINQAVQLKTKW